MPPESNPATRDPATIWIAGHIPHDDVLHRWIRSRPIKRYSAEAERFFLRVRDIWRNKYGVQSANAVETDPAYFLGYVLVEIDVVWPRDSKRRYAGRSIRTLAVALAHARAIDYAYSMVPRVRSVRRVGDSRVAQPGIRISRTNRGIIQVSRMGCGWFIVPSGIPQTLNLPAPPFKGRIARPPADL